MSRGYFACGVIVSGYISGGICPDTTANNSYSGIDHFVVSESLFCNTIDYYSMCDEIDNQSDHAPIIMSLKYNNDRKTIPHKIEERTC